MGVKPIRGRRKQRHPRRQIFIGKFEPLAQREGGRAELERRNDATNLFHAPKTSPTSCQGCNNASAGGNNYDTVEPELRDLQCLKIVDHTSTTFMVPKLTPQTQILGSLLSVDNVN